MKTISEKLGLGFTAFIDDIYAFDGNQNFDIISLDSMLHLKELDRKREIDLIH